ncbi:hypothetical protein EZV62_025282 [Acer yangbiense]|uniref:Condensin complex subunit 1 C-terminal domain-containing protein n=1 Tax=Acer yangbiense TaxID=1000413 RepID=A0A5C7GY33_9ROSI|nr:hypothetical protein EZV62_025282 [Acer yangbiense]
MDHFEELLEAGERLKNAGDMSHLVEDYIRILKLKKNSEKEKLLAATMIPKFFKYFLTHLDEVVSTHFRLFETNDNKVFRTTMMRYLVLCTHCPNKLPMAVNFLMEILSYEIDSRDVYKALLPLVKKDTKVSLTILFEHIWNPSKTDTREKVLNFIKDRVYTRKTSLLNPREEMEMYVTDLIKGCLEVAVDES